MSARNLTSVLHISERTWVRSDTSSLSPKIAYHGVGGPGGVLMT